MRYNTSGGWETGGRGRAVFLGMEVIAVRGKGKVVDLSHLSLGIDQSIGGAT